MKRGMKYHIKTALVALIFLASSATYHLVFSQTVPGTENESSTVINKAASKELTPAKAQTKIYKFKVGGTTSFSDIPPSRGQYIVWKPSCFACNVNSTIDWTTIRLRLDEFSDFINSSSKEYAIDPALVRAVIHAESNFNPKAKSPKGAMGLMQLMPATARSLGVLDASVPAHNIKGGVKYLATLLKRFKGDIGLAAAAYNAGPEAVDKYLGVPPYDETVVYVQRVKILHQRYKVSMPSSGVF
jgi:hypothetical protein